jgi:hypothetical protein
VNLRGLNPARNHDLPALRIIGYEEQGHGFCRGHPPVRLIIMADPDLLLVWNTEVDSDQGPLIAALQFAQPLMGDVEVSRYGRGEHTARKFPARAAQSANPVASNLSNA